MRIATTRRRILPQSYGATGTIALWRHFLVREREIYRGGSWRDRRERRGLRQGSNLCACARDLKNMGRELRRGGAVGRVGVRRR